MIQLSEVEVDPVFSEPIPTLLPFVSMMKGGETRIPEAVKQLQRDPVLSELDPLLAFFAGFVLESEVVAQIMRWDMTVLRESPWYEEIKQEGIQLGIQQVARNLLAMGLDPAQIATATGLTPEQIRQL